MSALRRLWSSRRLRRTVAGLFIVLALIAGLLVGRTLIIARRGSGLDPLIPADLRVAPSIHPELAEHSKIFEKKVYKIGDNVHAAVGWGLANIVFVEGSDGVIVVDTGESIEQGKEVLAEIRKITPKPIAAIVLTHHHADHVLGTTAFASAEDVAAGKIPIFAHDSLVRNYVAETGITAELQAARSLHMYGGSLLAADREGSNAGIGPFFGRGESGFLAPTKTFADRLDVTIAGVRLEMRWAPSEAESEIVAFLPDAKILLSAEVIQDHTFPNIYTIRGARFRDPLTWVRSIDMLREWEADAMVLQHGPPVLGRAEVGRVLTSYRDEIQYVHDQTVRRMNEGLSPEELAASVRLPEHLAEERPWGREYYGTVKHSVRNVYGGYEGWFQGDPVALDPTPPVELARRHVRLMGGRERVLAEAKSAYASGDSQFAAELATMLIRLDTKDMDARHLKAAAFRKLGYAQINASWRNYYLVSAMELDDQIPSAIYLREVKKILGPAMKGLPAEGQVALLPVRLKAEETLKEDVIAGVRYTDEGADFTLHLRRGVLEIAKKAAASPAFSIEVTRPALGEVLAGGSFEDQVSAGAIQVKGDAALARKFFGWFVVPFTAKPEVVVR
jgi:alkyl sulfatase BDS1-like metallo-beta-lactamase superfamily hydrolase